MNESTRALLIKLLDSISYYFVGEAARETKKDVLKISVDDIDYFKTSGRFGEVYVIDVFYSSEYGNHKSKIAKRTSIPKERHKKQRVQ